MPVTRRLRSGPGSVPPRLLGLFHAQREGIVRIPLRHFGEQLGLVVGASMNIDFERVDQRIREACVALEVETHQRHLIASNQRSLDQAEINRAAIPMLVRHDGQPVGFLMYEPRSDLVVSLHCFMIDRRYQGQGIGFRAMERLIEKFHADGYQTIYLSFRPENDAARSLYERLGFVEHEIEADGEVVYRLGPVPRGS